MKTVYVSFLIPVVDGSIYLGKRNTEPYRGLYGAIGGKSETAGKTGFYIFPETMITLGGHTKEKNFDRINAEQGREYGRETAVREFFEEAFSKLRYPRDFTTEDITDVFDLGFIVDTDENIPNTDFCCHFYLGNVHRNDFSLSNRELTDLKPLTQLKPEEIWPMTKMVLTHIKWCYEEALFGSNSRGNYGKYAKFKLEDQISKNLPLDKFRFTSLSGAVIACREQGLSIN